MFIIRKDFKSKRREKNYKNCTLNENTRKFEIINRIKNPITNRIFETNFEIIAILIGSDITIITR